MIFVAVGTIPRFRAFFRVQAAGFRPFVVDRAQTGFRVEKIAIPAGSARHGENIVLGVVVVDQLGFEQALGNQLGLDVLHLERVHQLQAHQISQLHLQRHGAAVGRASLAQTGAVLGPGFQSVDIDHADGGFHGVGAKGGGRPV